VQKTLVAALVSCADRPLKTQGPAVLDGPLVRRTSIHSRVSGRVHPGIHRKKAAAHVRNWPGGSCSFSRDDGAWLPGLLRRPGPQDDSGARIPVPKRFPRISLCRASRSRLNRLLHDALGGLRLQFDFAKKRFRNCVTFCWRTRTSALACCGLTYTPWKLWMATFSGVVWFTRPNRRKKSHRFTRTWTLLA